MDLVRLFRPQFLIAGAALNMLGAAVALHLGATMDWTRFALFQLVVAASQIAGACANEYADASTDRLNTNRTWFSGGSGMIVTGRVKAKTAIYAALFWTGLALATAAVLAFSLDAGVISFALMAVGISLALSYSIRPLMLSQRGFGEVLMAFMVSFLTPLTSSYIIYGRFDELAILVSLPLVLQMLGLMMVVEIPDREADLAVGKKTLVVRLGSRLSWNVGVLMLVAGGAAALAGYREGLPMMAAAVSAVLLLLEASVFWAIGRAPESRMKTFWSTAVSCGFYVLVIVVMAVSIGEAW